MRSPTAPPFAPVVCQANGRWPYHSSGPWKIRGWGPLLHSAWWFGLDRLELNDVREVRY